MEFAVFWESLKTLPFFCEKFVYTDNGCDRIVTLNNSLDGRTHGEKVRKFNDEL